MGTLDGGDGALHKPDPTFLAGLLQDLRTRSAAAALLGLAGVEQAPLLALRNRCDGASDAITARDALAACDELVAKHPGGNGDLARVLSARGTAHYYLGQYRLAEADDSQSLRLDPDSSSAHFNRGLANEHLGHPDDAIIDYSDAIRADAANGDAYLNRGALRFEKGQLDEATADFSKAHELSPKDIDPLTRRAFASAEKRDAARAERDLAAIRKIDPSSPIPLQGEAFLGLGAGNPQGAIDLLNPIIERDSTDAWSLNLRANAYRMLGQKERALADLTRIEHSGRAMAGPRKAGASPGGRRSTPVRFFTRIFREWQAPRCRGAL